VLILLAGALYAFVTLRNPGAAPVVQTIRPRSEARPSPRFSSRLATSLHITRYRSIEDYSRVAWIGVEKGNRVRRDQSWFA